MSKMSEIHMMVHEAIANGADANDIIIELVGDYNIDRAFARMIVEDLEQQYYDELENSHE